MGTPSYHIDICYIWPRESFAAKARAAGDAPHCLHPEAPQNTIAKFRDPATVAALRDAPSWVQEVFRKAGFGLEPSGHTRPFDQFDEREDLHRMQKIQALMEGLKPRDAVCAAFEGGLDMAALQAHEARIQRIAAQKSWAGAAASPPLVPAPALPSGPPLSRLGQGIIAVTALAGLMALPLLGGRLASHFDGALEVSNIRIVTLSFDE